MGALGGFAAGGLGMGVAFVLEDYFSKTADDIQRSMDQLDGNTSRISNSISNSLKMMGVGAGLAAAGIGSLAIFKKGSDVRAEFQAYETRFETLLGSADRASKFFNQIKQDAKDNPIFGTESLTSANAALVATGRVAEEQSRRIVNNLAEIMAGVGAGDEELKNMAVNLQQIGNNGKATGMDIKQFGMAGVPIMKILADSMGTTAEAMEGVDITLDQLDKAFAHATSSGQMFYKASDRAAQSTKGLKAAMEDNIEITWERIGAAIEPITRKLYQNIIGITDSILAFLDTPVGQRVAQWVFYLAAFLAIAGTGLAVVGGLRIGLIKLAGAFGANTKQTILATIAQKGFAAGLRATGRAAWASLGPYILIAVAVAALVAVYYKASEAILKGNERMAQIGFVVMALTGPLGLLIGMIVGVYRGFTELKKPMDEMATTGILGFFTRVAATIYAVWEIFKTFNGESSEISEELYLRLEKLGIIPLVEKIGAAVVRIKNFFFGLRDGLMPIWDVVVGFVGFLQDKFLGIFERIKKTAGDVWDSMGKNMQPLVSLIRRVYAALFGTEESLGTWRLIGHIVGTIVTGAFKGLIWVLEFIINIFAGLVEGIIWGVGLIIQGAIWLGGTFASIFTGMWDIVSGFMMFLWELPSTIVNFGVSMVTSIWEGFMQVFPAFAQWVEDKLLGILSTITDKVKAGFNAVKDFFGFGDDDENKPVTPNNNPVGLPSDGGGANGIQLKQRHHTQTSKSPIVVGGGAGSGAAGGGMQPIILQNWMDGEMVSEKMIERQELKNARKD